MAFGEPSTRRRSDWLSKRRETIANGFTGWVQSPRMPQVSGTAIQASSQKLVGRMFSGTSWLPASPQ